MGRSSTRVFVLAVVVALVLGALALRPFVGAAAEPNDSFDAATPIGFNFTYRDAITAGSDVDYFSFTVGAVPTELTISLTELPANYDLELYGPDRVLRASSNRDDILSESISYTATEANSYYYVRVFSPDGESSGAEYALRIDAIVPTPTIMATPTPTNTPADPYEPNDAYPSQRRLFSGQRVEARLLPGQDRDFFSIRVAHRGSTIRATLSGLPADYDLFLDKPDQSPAASSTNAGTTAESITYSVGETVGQYYLVVLSPSDASSTVNYVLDVTVDPPVRREGRTLVVDSEIDEPDVAPGDGVCRSGSGVCTWRAAIMEANALAGPNTIRFPAGTFRQVRDPSRDFFIRNEVYIEGAGVDLTTLDGTNSRDGLVVEPGGAVEASNLQITRGYHNSVRVSGGVVTLRNVRVTNSGRDGLTCDAVVNYGDLTLVDSSIVGNRTTGIANHGNLAVVRSLVSSNSDACGFTAGISNHGPAWIADSTVTGNITRGQVGGVSNSPESHFGFLLRRADLSIVNSTLVGNQAAGGAVDVTSHEGSERSLILRNTIVGRCFATGHYTSLGHNLETADTCGLRAEGDQVNTDPRLGPLVDNGGPTQTMALLPDSAAIDRADDGACSSTDQRGVARPQGAACDVGAYERQAGEVSPTPSPTTNPAPVPPAGPNRLILPVVPESAPLG